MLYNIFLSFLGPLLFSALFTAGAAQCSASERLVLTFLNETIYPDAVCADGTTGGYYFGKKEDIDPLIPENRSYVIWLGDSSLCAGRSCDTLCANTQRNGEGEFGFETVCDDISADVIDLVGDIDIATARCLYSRATCTSEWWNIYDTVTAGTILCEDDPDFGDYTRVFLPSCTLDYFLGNGNTTSDELSGQENATRFRGSVVFDSVIETLMTDNQLAFAPRIVLGGTRGGGIGALNLITRLREKVVEFLQDFPELEIPEFYVIADSSWIVSVEKFAPTDAELANGDAFQLDETYKVNSSEWIQDASINEDCRSRFEGTGDLYKCLFPSELVKSLVVSGSEIPVLIIQSEYDMFQLQDLGITNPEAEDQFVDEASYAQAAVTFIEGFGESVRSSINTFRRGLEGYENNLNSNVFFLNPACGQHGYIVPTRIHTIDPQTQNLGEAGAVTFRRDEDIWLDLRTDTGGFSARESILLFINTAGTAINNNLDRKISTDSCGTFLCNPQCVTEIVPFTVESLVSGCLQQLVFVYAFFIIFIFLFMFFLSYIKVLGLRGQAKRFWADVSMVEEMRKEKDKKLREEKDNDIQFLRQLIYQRNQTADEVQEQMINETNADSEYRKAHLMVENLNYWVPPKKSGLKEKLFGSSTKSKVQILRDVTLSFAPGKVHAIMGPSGSGKSTLLDILAMTKNIGEMSGTNYINGVSSRAKSATFFREWLKLNSSYVTQQDFFFPNITVREHLEHAAWLILPEYMSAQKKLNRVWQVMRILDLDTCADTICGDGGVAFEGGLSGGQRRRLSIATQLLLNPCVLFLDEPTSGLDSVSALNLCRRLQLYAKNAGVNVIMSIHQPRREIFQFLDSLHILVRGKVVFSGSPAQTSEFFGLNQADRKLNIGNELLDIFKSVDSHESPIVLEYQQKFTDSQEKQNMLIEIQKERVNLSADLLKEVRELLVLNSLAEGRFSWKSPSSVFWMNWVLISRTMKRNGLRLQVTLPLAVFAGLVLGGLFFQKDTYDGKIGLAYLCVGTLTFLQGVFLARRYFDEKDMYDFEYRSGTMRSWQSFILAQFNRDAVTAVLESLAFAIPAYGLAGFSLETDRIIRFLVLTCLVGFACTCQNVLIQINRNETRSAATIQIGLLALGALFNGFIVRLEDIPVYYSWIPYLMLSFYGFVGVLVNELSNFSLPCDISVLECASRTGDLALRALDYDRFDVFLCAVCLIAIIVIFRLLSVFNFYVSYTRIGSIKRIRGDKSGSRDLPESNNPEAVIIQALNKKNAEFKAIDDSVNAVREGEDPNVKRLLTQEDLKGKSTTAAAFYASQKSAATDYYVDEDEDEDGEEIQEKPQEFEYSGLNAFFLDKVVLAVIFAVDLASAGLICLYNDENSTILIGYSTVFLAVYAAQLAYQMGVLIPFTLDQKANDFGWAIEYDGPSVFLLIVDVCLVFLQFGVNETIDVRQLLTLVIRVVRLMRVYCYFAKVDKAHQLRAKSFITAKETLFNEYINEKMNSQANGNAPGKQGRPQSSNFVKGLRQSARLRNFEIARLQNALSDNATVGGGRRSNRLSATLSARDRGSRYNPRLSARLSGALAPPSANRLSRSLSGNFSNAPRQKRVIGPGWQKFRNEKTGQVIYYNPYTGEYLDTKVVDVEELTTI